MVPMPIFAPMSPGGRSRSETGARAGVRPGMPASGRRRPAKARRVILGFSAGLPRSFRRSQFAKACGSHHAARRNLKTLTVKTLCNPTTHPARSDRQCRTPEPNATSKGIEKSLRSFPVSCSHYVFWWQKEVVSPTGFEPVTH